MRTCSIYTGAEFDDGDFDGDGDVDQTDMDLWYANFSSPYNLSTIDLLGDLDGDFDVDDADGDIDTGDLDLMFAQLGLELTVVS